MAKQRPTEPARARTPPPPRMTGAGLPQIAMIGGFVALLAAIIGVFAASGSHDPWVDRRADSLGGAMAALLATPDPEGWSVDAGSVSAVWRQLGEHLDKAQRPKKPKKHVEIDHKTKEANKSARIRIENALRGFGPDLLQGVLIRFSPGTRIGNVSMGARINAGEFQSQRFVFDGVAVGKMFATLRDTTSAARVYHKEYRDRKNKRVGDVYVILSEAIIQANSGAGMWIFLTPLLVAVGVGLFVLSAVKLQAGIKGVARDLDTIGRGKLDARISLGGSGEVGFLQRCVDRMAKNLSLIQTTGSGDLDEAIEKELDLASQIHQSLRPADPPRIPGYELETLFKPGRDIGGDYFDYVDLDEKRIALIIADCSESLRGVPAAMVMAMTRAYLKTAADPEQGPAEWLKWANRRLARDLKSGMAVTALVVVADTSTGEMIAASAGHRPIVMWRQGKIATINPNGIALGLDVGPVFEKTIEEKKFTMQKNDRIVMHTDGVVLARNEADEEYGEARFHESIRKQGAMNSAAFVNFVAGGVAQFLGDAEQTDDITVSTLKRMK